MRRSMFIFAAVLMLVGCKGNTFDGVKNIDDSPKEHYRWNPSSGKAGEGRCHEVSKDGTLGKFVPSEYCGR